MQDFVRRHPDFPAHFLQCLKKPHDTCPTSLLLSRWCFPHVSCVSWIFTILSSNLIPLACSFSCEQTGSVLKLLFFMIMEKTTRSMSQLGKILLPQQRSLLAALPCSVRAEDEVSVFTTFSGLLHNKYQPVLNIPNHSTTGV